jgi:TPR repeat protein
MYANGRGLPKDLKQAAQWYRKAADQGLDSAQLNLGAMYYSGDGVPKNAVEALKYFRLSAQQKNGHAQFNLASLYAAPLQGDGIMQDLARALVWFTAAASTLAGEEAKIANANVTEVASKMTQPQLRAAQAIVRECRDGNYKKCD